MYLTDSAAGEFSADDQALVTALASTAGIAIENARLFARGEQQQTWLRAATEITHQLLSEQGADPLELIADRTRQVADGDLAAVILPMRDDKRLMVEVASGAPEAELNGYSYPMANTYAERVLKTGRPILMGDLSEHPNLQLHLATIMPVGPVMMLPLVGTTRLRGVLSVARRAGRPRFDEADLEMATAFANHAAIALGLADAREAQKQKLLLEERDRIARDLHDHVIQQLFAAGLTVESVLAARAEDDAGSDRLAAVVAGIDATIRQIRTAIFRLRGPVGPESGTARSRILDVLNESVELLGFRPQIEFSGPVDLVVPEPVVDDLVAVVREGLTNVAKHAGADHAIVALTAGVDQLTLEVIDDGGGIAGASRRSGLANLRSRARQRGGSLTIGAAKHWGNERKGVHLSWKIPLDPGTANPATANPGTANPRTANDR